MPGGTWLRAFHEGLAARDSVTALSLLAEDVVIYESGGVEASREEYRSHHLPAGTGQTAERRPNLHAQRMEAGISRL